MSTKVLVVEDDKEIAGLVSMHVRDMGHEVHAVHDGEKGYQQAQSGGYDVVILDVMLPNMDGMEICSRLRQDDSNALILMLTAKSSEIDRVMGLEIGADDYLIKPFSVRELQARVRALLRRKTRAVREEKEEANFIEFGTLRIDVEKRDVRVGSQILQLTNKEFELLVQFARNPGRVYTRTQLLDLVWGYGYDGYEHTVNSHINRLRNKIEDNPTEPQFIQTVWGVGYKFVDTLT